MTRHHQTRRVQQLVLRAALLLGVGCGLAVPASARDDMPGFARVRSTDPSLAALIARATGHSATFHRLIATIQDSNGMVYVEVGTCGFRMHACLRRWMTSSGPNRFLFVIIERQTSDSDVDVMASIGHELQHTVEALSEPGVIDTDRLYAFFSRVALTRNGFFETIAAIDAGDDVRSELRRR